jgi:molybdopterin synthase sulfur carrier subunit
VTVKVHVRYFASLREVLGADESVELDDRTATIETLRDTLIALGGRHAEVLGRGRPVRAALNRTLAPESAALADGDEVGFFPPVTGG